MKDGTADGNSKPKETVSIELSTTRAMQLCAQIASGELSITRAAFSKNRVSGQEIMHIELDHSGST